MVQENQLPIVTYEVVVKAGSAVDNHNNAGLAAIVADMLTKGTKKLDADAYAEALADIGSSIHSSCDKDSAGLGLGVLATHADRGLSLLADALLRPAFDNTEFERLKRLKTATLEKRSREPALIGFRSLLRKSLWRQNTLTGTPPRGNLKTLKNINLRQVRQFYKAQYSPATTTLIAVGDFDKEKILKSIKVRIW